MKRFLPVLSSFLCMMILIACAFPTIKDALPAPTPPADAPDAAESVAEILINVYDEESAALISVPLERYTAAVVRAEMPLSYAPEALKAQAVAARTYAVQKSRLFQGEGCVRHAGADVCTNPACCQGCAFSVVSDAAEDAAEATKNEVVSFRGHPIRALYHACAGGHTEDAENVYVSAIAYLRGVPSPGEEAYAQYSDAASFTYDQLVSAFQGYEDVMLIEDLALSDQLEVLSRSGAGRVISIRVGLTSMSGSEFRRALGLRSANFTLSFPENTVCVSTLGSGHGVGMSQTGADAMAKSGADYAEILHWYYTDTQISDLASLLSGEAFLRPTPCISLSNMV